MSKILIRGIFGPFVFAVFLSFGAVRADLPPEAQQVVTQGLDAIEKRDYPLAERSFEDARKKGGAQVYYNIGQAESTIPGRELRAICWFGAYLSSAPQAPDAAEVKKEIASLDQTSRDKTLHLIQAMQEAIRQMPEGDERNYGLRDMVGRWTGFGDFAAAQEAVDFIQAPNTKSDALENLANAYVQLIYQQVAVGDMAGARDSRAKAQKAVDLIPNVNTKTPAQVEAAEAWIALAHGQLNAGDLKGVQESLATAEKLDEPIESPGSRYSVWEDIAGMQVAMARAQLKAGDAAGAHESLTAALKTTHLLQGDPYNGSLGALQDIAETQMKAGDFRGARESLAAAVPSAHDAHGLRDIGQEQVRAGDLGGAKKTAALIQTDARWKFVIENDIAAAEIKAGDLASARETLARALKAANLIPDAETKSTALHDIAKAQFKTGDATAARETLAATLKTIDLFPEGQKGLWQQAIAEAQLEIGDKEGAQKTAGLIHDAALKAATLQEMAQPPKKSEPEPVAAPGPSPLMNPLPSDEVTMASRPSNEAWLWMLRESFDAPPFTAFPDYSDVKAIAAEIQKIPVRNGQARRPGPLDQMRSLALVTNYMIAAQKEVDETLKLQFKK